MSRHEADIKRRKRKHFRDRLMERFGLIISDDQIADMVNEIYSFTNKPIKILEDTGNSFHLFNVQGTEIIVLFDWGYDSLITVYYKSWFKKINDKYDRYYQKTSREIRRDDRSKTFAHKTGIYNGLGI